MTEELWQVCQTHEHARKAWDRLYSQVIRDPSLGRKVILFARAALRHISAGLPTVTDEEKSRRLALCQVCPEFDAQKQSCRRCGCKMKLKASWALEKCPIGHW